MKRERIRPKRGKCESNKARTQARANGRDVELDVHGTGLTFVEWRTFVASATEQGKTVDVSSGLEWSRDLKTASERDEGQGRQG